MHRGPETLTLSNVIFDSKGNPVDLLRKWYFFHIPTVEKLLLFSVGQCSRYSAKGPLKYLNDSFPYPFLYFISWNAYIPFDVPSAWNSTPFGRSRLASYSHTAITVSISRTECSVSIRVGIKGTEARALFFKFFFFFFFLLLFGCQ